MTRTSGEDPLDVVSGTAEAAFATDEAGRIVIWNKAAERLLGFAPAGVLGRPCHEVLCGRDVFGNAYCGGNCCLMSMAARREPIHRFEMEVRKVSGESIEASFSIVVVPGARRNTYNIVHVFRPTTRGPEADELLRKILRSSPAPAPPAAATATATASATAQEREHTHGVTPLTGRELEVLRLMADGASTQEMADALFISKTTVRNHVQHILEKLDVHSKLEAVALAFRTQLF